MRPSNARTWWSVALCSVLLAGCGAAATSSATQAPTATPASSAPASSPADGSDVAAAPAAPAATRVSTGLEGALLHGIAASADGMVAVGAAGAGAAAWTSSDGVAWQPMEVASAGDATALRAVALDGGGVAFGATDTGRSRIWSATDGSQPWEPADGGGIDGHVNAVAVAGDRRVAVGDVLDAEGGGAAAGAVWTSDDGLRWEPLADLPLNEGTVSDVVVNAGTVVVVGFDVDGGRVWTSTGDEDLEAVDAGEFATATIQGVAHTDGGYVALGRALDDLRPIVWRSDDGLTWNREELPGDAFAPDLQINDLTTVDGTLVAVGAAPEGGAVWTSHDGASWTLHAPAPAGATEHGS
jgi:hypothetical protein